MDTSRIIIFSFVRTLVATATTTLLLKQTFHHSTKKKEILPHVPTFFLFQDHV